MIKFIALVYKHIDKILVNGKEKATIYIVAFLAYICWFIYNKRY